MSTNATGTLTYTPTTFTYDAYGQVASELVPRDFTFTPQYDLEAESLTNSRMDFGYTKRGEVMQVVPGTRAPARAALFANGAVCANADTCTYDARSSGVDSTLKADPTTSYVNAHTYAYDSAGRQTQDTVSICGVSGSAPVLQRVSQRTYDADNHLIEQTLPQGYESGNPICGAQPGTVTNPTYTQAFTFHYAWDPDGHLGTLADFGYAQTLGWDGDTLLYSAVGSSVTLYLEKLGFLAQVQGTPQFYVIERDPTGAGVGGHTARGYSAVNVDPLHPSALPDKPGPAGGVEGDPTSGYQSYVGAIVPGSPALSANRTDGYSDTVNTFQGVRAYDPATNQWTTPDAYAGDVHDPMSQKPYMWNNNNPLAYADPSGYDSGAMAMSCAVDKCSGGGVTLPANIDFYAKIEVSGSVGPFSAGGSYAITANGYAFKSPAGGAGKGGKNFLHPMFGYNVSVSVGVVVPKKDKTSSNVLSGLSLGAAAAEGVGGEIGGNQSGGYAGVVFSLSPFASAGASLGIPIGAPHAKRQASVKPK